MKKMWQNLFVKFHRNHLRPIPFEIHYVQLNDQIWIGFSTDQDWYGLILADLIHKMFPNHFWIVIVMYSINQKNWISDFFSVSPQTAKLASSKIATRVLVKIQPRQSTNFYFSVQNVCCFWIIGRNIFFFIFDLMSIFKFLQKIMDI